MPFCNCIAQIRTAHRTSVTHHLTFRRMSATGTQYTWYAWRNRPSSKMADMTSLMPHLSMDSTGPGLQSIRTKTPRERCQAVIHYNQTERDKRRLRICLVSETRASSDLDAHRTSIDKQTRTLCDCTHVTVRMAAFRPAKVRPNYSRFPMVWHMQLWSQQEQPSRAFDHRHMVLKISHFAR